MKRRCLSAPLVLLLWPLVLLASCAAMIRGDKDSVYFEGSPEGGQVRVRDATYSLPAMVEVPRSTKSVVFFHPEHGEREVRLEVKTSFGFVLMDLLFTPGFGLVGLMIDGATGALRDFDGTVRVDFRAPLGPVEERGEAAEASPEPEMPEDPDLGVHP